jgi:3-hydroxybutyrate dehydrogenase
MDGFDFTSRRVLVTGASHGIGFAVARIQAESGHIVRALQCDVTDREAIRRTVGALGTLDVLISNAGLELITPLLEPGDEVEKTFVRIIEINVIGTYYVCRAAVPLIARGGSIVLTSSIWGKIGAADFSAYVTSKHANIGFMRTLAKELGPKGIRVNAVCPGWVRTRAALRSLKEVAARADTSEEAVLEDILSAQALPGLMEPDDVASLYLFLASDHSASITGQAYNVDRGEVMA